MWLLLCVVRGTDVATHVLALVGSLLTFCNLVIVSSDAHAATETIESYLAMHSGQLPVLSQQQGADCTSNPKECGGNGGCGGGTAKLVIASYAQMGVSSVWSVAGWLCSRLLVPFACGSCSVVCLTFV